MATTKKTSPVKKQGTNKAPRSKQAAKALTIYLDKTQAPEPSPVLVYNTALKGYERLDLNREDLEQIARKSSTGTGESALDIVKGTPKESAMSAEILKTYQNNERLSVIINDYAITLGTLFGAKAEEISVLQEPDLANKIASMKLNNETLSSHLVTLETMLNTLKELV